MPKKLKPVKAKHNLLKADGFAKSTHSKKGATDDTEQKKKSSADRKHQGVESQRSKFALERLALKERHMRQSGCGGGKKAGIAPQIVLTESALPYDMTTITHVKEMNLIDQLLEDEANVVHHEHVQPFYPPLPRAEEGKRRPPANVFEVLAEENQSSLAKIRPLFQLAPSLLERVVPPRTVDDDDDI